MRRIEPVIKVAALMGAIIGERWLRGQIRRGIVEKGHAKNLKPSPKSPAPSYRSASSWAPGSDIASALERPKRWSKR
jgi:hypothetical protein